MEVGDAYSQAIDGILAHPDIKDWEYVLTMEHDNLPPADGLVRLIERMEEHPELARHRRALLHEGLRRRAPRSGAMRTTRS